MAKAWLIAVMVETAGQAEPQRQFFAVGHDDRARAEWKAIDRAMLMGPIATSPVGGLEPVQAICAILGTTVSHQALLPGEVRPLGPRWPRRWVSSQTD